MKKFIYFNISEDAFSEDLIGMIRVSDKKASESPIMRNGATDKEDSLVKAFSDRIDAGDRPIGMVRKVNEFWSRMSQPRLG